MYEQKKREVVDLTEANDLKSKELAEFVASSNATAVDYKAALES